MFKTGRKGRISNELAAASCAAILAVYAAGTWRTRDADRRFGVEGQMRRPVQPAREPAAPTPVAPIPAAVLAPLSVAPPPLPAEVEPKAAPQKSAKVEAAPPPSAPQQTAASPPSSEPITPVVAAAAVAEETALEAEAEVIADEAEPAPTRARWLDGYYTGWGTSRHGDIQAFVRIEDNRIVDSGIATCETRYPCSVIENILLQPIDLQSAEVDRVSRATESADAYYYGLVMALENATTGTFRSKRP